MIGEASKSPNCLRAGAETAEGTVVLDLNARRGGLEALHELKGLCPNLPVVVLSMHPEDQFAVGAACRGAGYLTKESAAGISSCHQGHLEGRKIHYAQSG